MGIIVYIKNNWYICSMGKIVTTSSFIEESKKIHKNKYNYSLVEYINAKSKVKIVCPVHGIFEQTPNKHKLGCGCRYCANNIKYSTKEFIENAILKHGNLYNYHKVNYISREIKVEIECKKHGFFLQYPFDHINSKGCKKCGYYSSALKQKTHLDDFINKSNLIHNYKYGYNLVSFKNLHNKVKIVCKKHGVFFQTAKHHMDGQGCKKCSKQGSSNIETSIADSLSSLCDIQKNIKNIISTELDIYIPDKQTAIEINGIYWHSDKFLPNNYHYKKFMECKSKNIQLIQIFEDTIINNKQLVESFLKSKIGIFDKKINARDCVITSICYKEYEDFLNHNHLQSKVSGTHYLGLFLQDELVSVIGFKKIKNKIYDLNRFCSKQNYLVRGGFSKLLKYFVRNYNPSKITTFSDNNYSDGGLYIKNGFKKVSDISPDYKYLYKNSLHHKFGFRKSNLKKMFPHSSGSEREITLANKIYRVYDSGKQKFELTLNNI
jgi:hypothetical protein